MQSHTNTSGVQTQTTQTMYVTHQDTCRSVGVLPDVVRLIIIHDLWISLSCLWISLTLHQRMRNAKRAKKWSGYIRINRTGSYASDMYNYSSHTTCTHTHTHTHSNMQYITQHTNTEKDLTWSTGNDKLVPQMSKQVHYTRSVHLHVVECCVGSCSLLCISRLISYSYPVLQCAPWSKTSVHSTRVHTRSPSYKEIKIQY